MVVLETLLQPIVRLLVNLLCCNLHIVVDCVLIRIAQSLWFLHGSALCSPRLLPLGGGSQIFASPLLLRLHIDVANHHGLSARLSELHRTRHGVDLRLLQIKRLLLTVQAQGSILRSSAFLRVRVYLGDLENRKLLVANYGLEARFDLGSFGFIRQFSCVFRIKPTHDLAGLAAARRQLLRISRSVNTLFRSVLLPSLHNKHAVRGVVRRGHARRRLLTLQRHYLLVACQVLLRPNSNCHSTQHGRLV
jgi:hypothetical protein